MPNSQASGNHKEYLKNLLNDPLFNVIEIEQKCPKGNTEIDQSYAILKELWKYKDLNEYVMILKTDSITLQNTELLVDTIKRSIEINSDLYYFARYLDKCQLNTIIEGTNSEQMPELIQTWFPQGLQCVMFSPHGLGVVLGEIPMKNGNKFILTKPLSQQLTIEVAKGNITAMATNPVVFVFDTTFAENNIDYLMANVCQPIDLNPPPSSSGNFLLLILVIVIVVIAAWAVIVIFRKREPSSSSSSSSKTPSFSSKSSSISSSSSFV